MQQHLSKGHKCWRLNHSTVLSVERIQETEQTLLLFWLFIASFHFSSRVFLHNALNSCPVFIETEIKVPKPEHLIESRRHIRCRDTEMDSQHHVIPAVGIISSIHSGSGYSQLMERRPEEEIPYRFLASLGRIGLSTLKEDFIEFREVLSDTMVSESWLSLWFLCRHSKPPLPVAS
ncbi:hypothetical protein JZ751_012319 [Albula glossodonta]|uniref:Uncharacterized protein n=1 Tax=Albula glossodonta TaxID=121402 RepID=A0A8T2PS66_9TELE|nr:hypothetical protein JZ751_012319 [Albula glossodonta]